MRTQFLHGLPLLFLLFHCDQFILGFTNFVCCSEGTVLVILVHQLVQRRREPHLLQVVGIGHELEAVRPVGDPLEAVDSQAVLAHDASDLVVLALIELHVQPRVRVLAADNFCVVWTILPPTHHAACSDLGELGVIEGPAEDSYLVCSFNPIRGQLKGSGELTVICDQQQAFAQVVEPAYRYDVLMYSQILQPAEDSHPSLWVKMSRHHLSRLVVEPKSSILLHWCIRACFGADFDLALVIDWYVAVYHFPVDFDHPLTNQFLRHSSRSYAHSSQSLRQAFSFAKILDCAHIDKVIKWVL